MQHNIIRRQCDFCGEKKDFNKDSMTPEQEKEMANWITLVREFLIEGQAFPVMKHACKNSCAANLCQMDALVLPTEFQQARRRN